MKEYETTIENQFRQLARLRDNYDNLADDIAGVDEQIGSVGDQDLEIDADFMIEDLLQQIKQEGLRFGNWKLKQEMMSDNLVLFDLKRGGWYKFAKTMEAHVIQGIKDQGPNNGKSINPLALLGLSPNGKVSGVQKTYVTSLY